MLTSNEIIAHAVESRMVNYISTLGQMIPCNPPKMMNECACHRCGSSLGGMTCHVNAQNEPGPIMWFCQNHDCLWYNVLHHQDKSMPMKRAVEFSDFCARYNIGDTFHNVKFEHLIKYHSPSDVQQMRDFAHKPCAIGLFTGAYGVGKTYACYAILELFLREKTSAAFYNAEDIMHNLNSDDKASVAMFKKKINEVELLVIDDFAQRGELPSGTMSFIFKLLDSRMGYSNRATLFTTNQSAETIKRVCGGAFMSRMSTAKLKIHFGDKSLRV